MKKFSNWFPVFACIKCNEAIGHYSRAYSDGVCPHCGNHSRGTFCDTNTIVLRRKLVSNGFVFWNKKFIYEGFDEIANKWLNKHGYVTKKG